MFIGYRSRIIAPTRRLRHLVTILTAATLLGGLVSIAYALSSDRDQPMHVDADYQKSVQSKTGKADDPDITHLDGNVKIVQGSMKIDANHATVYQNPSGVADAEGNVGGITRVVFTGNPAHMQQVHDGDCRLMTAQAETIDYDNVTGIATLTGNVTLVQKDKGEFHGQNMIYNTNTGDMESGNKSPSSRVHMVIQPKEKTPAAASTGNCGYPGTAKPKKTKKSSVDH